LSWQGRENAGSLAHYCHKRLFFDAHRKVLQYALEAYLDRFGETKLELANEHLGAVLYSMIINLIIILIGIIFLIVGQRIFWLFIASLGFLFGVEFASTFFAGQVYWKTLLISVICGLLGLVCSLFLQELGIIVTGFIAGGYIFLSLWNLLGWRINEWGWLLFFLSGIIVSSLLLIFFNPVLIVLSSGIGAMIIIQALPTTPAMKILLFLLLFAFGVFVQSNHYFYANH
jgi:hypothetical protein